MSTIEIYGAPKIENYYCLYCGFDMTKTMVCIDCNEYKSAVTLDEYYEHNGHYPRLRAVK
jgi:predicted ATP-dependent serine protease